jgi:hypothetical protein
VRTRRPRAECALGDLAVVLLVLDEQQRAHFERVEQRIDDHDAPLAVLARGVEHVRTQSRCAGIDATRTHSIRRRGAQHAA